MPYRPVTVDQAIQGRSLKSFLLSAGYFPQVTHGTDGGGTGQPANQSWGWLHTQSHPRHHFVTVKGVNVIGGDPVPNSAWKLSGNHVWYQSAQFATAEGEDRLKKFMALDEKDESFFKKFKELGMDRFDDDNLTGGWTERYTYGDYERDPISREFDYSEPGRFGGVDPVNPMIAAHSYKKDVEREFFKRMYQVFAHNASRESGRFLSSLNNQLRNEVRRAVGGGELGHRRQTTVNVTTGSRMSEEQARVSEYGRPQERGIGRTEPIDTVYYNMGGNIYIDVSDMPVTMGGQHGIGPDGIAISSRDLTQAEAGNFDNVRTAIYEHYQERIGMFNETIVAIRENAMDLKRRQQDQSPLTAAEMRRGGFGMGDRYRTSSGGRAPALSHRRNTAEANRTIENASASTAAILAEVTRRGGQQIADYSAVAFTLHALGTFNEHQGDYYHGMTVSRNPHITTSVRFRMFAANHASRAFEYRTLNEQRDVIVSYGYASLEILRRRNMLNTANYVNHVRQQKNVQAASRYIKGATQITFNGIQTGGFRGGSRWKTESIIGGRGDRSSRGRGETISRGGFGSVAIHIPSGWSDVAINNAIEMMQSGSFSPQRAGQGRFAHDHALQVRLHAEQESAIENGFNDNTVFWPRQLDFWATPYYGYATSGGLEDIGQASPGSNF